MAERTHLEWFRGRLAASDAIEPKDPAPILAWREAQRERIRFKADLIGLDEVRGWSRTSSSPIRSALKRIRSRCASRQAKIGAGSFGSIASEAASRPRN